MRKSLHIFLVILLTVSSAFLKTPRSFSASGDLALSDGSVWFSMSEYLEGGAIRIWASAQNNSPNDLLGSIRFSTEEGIIDSDQPISALAGKTDEVFVDWTPPAYGTFLLTITVIPWDSSSDNPDNNTVQKEMTVLQDTDRDSIPNTSDPDKDGDGVLDEEDAFPLTYSESKDTDGDGQGNNADLDDDNDGTPDTQDQLPEDARYTADQDGDLIPDEEDEDMDGDGLSNEEESKIETDERNPDTDQDSVVDGQDVFPLNSSESKDMDEDGEGDNSDADRDGDSLENATDPDPNNPAPVAGVEQAVYIADIGEEIIFDGSPSEDDSGILQYLWSFGDNETVEGAEVSRRFDVTGLQIATLTVTDGNGQSDSIEIKVRVLNYTFLLKAGLFTLLLVALAFYLIYRYTRRVQKPKKARKRKP